jgi:hypothetical protein
LSRIGGAAWTIIVVVAREAIYLEGKGREGKEASWENNFRDSPIFDFDTRSPCFLLYFVIFLVWANCKLFLKLFTQHGCLCLFSLSCIVIHLEGPTNASLASLWCSLASFSCYCYCREGDGWVCLDDGMDGLAWVDGEGRLDILGKVRWGL